MLCNKYSIEGRAVAKAVPSTFFSQCLSSQACLSHRLSGPSRPTFEITHRPFGLGSPNAPAVIATPLPDEAVAYRPASPASLRYQSMMEGIQNSAGRKTATYRPMASVIYILNMRGWGGAIPGTPPPLPPPLPLWTAPKLNGLTEGVENSFCGSP